MIQFKLTNKRHRFTLGYGDYKVYITGGFSMENFDLLDVHLIELNSGRQIKLKELNMKPRDLINGKRAIACYSFWIDQYTEYEIEFRDFEFLTMKKSMLFFRNLLFPSHIDLKEIDIIIK
jgi:hypothetical protein